MMNDPYAGGEANAAVYAEPQRTSVMAILSLVCSLVCCIPGLSVLGALLGVGALIGIGGSGGRVGGKGLAVAGIIIGILVTVLWVGGLMGARQFGGMYVGLVEPVMMDVEAGDNDAVRVSFDPASQPTDGQLLAFRAAYQGEYGSFIDMPQGWGIISAFMDPSIGPLMQSYSGRQDLIPIAGNFDSGVALIIFEFDPNTQQGGGQMSFTDMVIVRPDGSEIRLSEPEELAP